MTIDPITTLTITIIIILTAILLMVLLRFIYRPVLRPYNDPDYFIKKIQPTIDHDNKVVVCLGDSITHGIVSGNYVQFLNEKYQNNHIKFVNAGINSELAWNVLQRIEPALKCQPDYITILIGTNDANATLSEKELKRHMHNQHLPQIPTKEWFYQTLIKLINAIQNYKNPKTGLSPKIGLFSIPTIGEIPDEIAYQKSAEYSEVIKKVAHETNVTYLALYENMHDILSKKDIPNKFQYKDINKLLLLNVFKHLFFRRNLDKISSQHGFWLHPDYLHLNERSIQIVMDYIEWFISNK
jgi:acyl-CoA thioesterase-1